jgi:hypothetical protein
MPQPTLSDVHVNVPLTNLSNMYLQEASAFVAERVFPIVPVQKISDVYYTYNRGDFNRNQMKKRAPGAESAGSGYNLDNSGSYLCDVWSLHKDIPDQVRANSDSVLQPDLETTSFLSMQARISREVDWASKFFGAVWTNNWTGVSSGPSSTQVLQWNDPASTPIIDVRNLKRTVQLTGTFRPNKMILGRPVFDTLCDHPDFVDRVKYGQTAPQPAKVTLAVMASLFELDEVLVMDAIQNTSVEQAPQAPGVSTNLETNAFIGNKAMLLVYTPSAPGIMTPGCGYTFAWSGYFGASTQGTRVKSFYMPWIESTRVEMDAAYAHKQVSADLGGYIGSVIA